MPADLASLEPRTCPGCRLSFIPVRQTQIYCPAGCPCGGRCQWPDGTPVTPWADPWHDVLADISDSVRDLAWPTEGCLWWEGRGPGALIPFR